MTRSWNKYRAKKANCQQGHTHGSKKEANRCNELSLLEKAGAIRRLEQQPKFWFVIDGRQVKHKNGRKVGYTADFRYREGGDIVVEEVKGFAARDYALRRAIFLALFPTIKFREV